MVASSAGLDGVTFDALHAHEVDAAFALEVAGFPADEAATLDKLQYRQLHAPELFFGAFVWTPPARRRLLGFVCSTRANAAELTHDSMSTHEAGGRSVMLHSVCVDESMRRKGLATALLRAYIDRLRQRDDVDRVRLLAHDELIGLYESAGFGLIGKSGVEHGSRPWFELGIEMRHPSPGLPFGARSMTAVLADEGKTARADLFCPRAACRSFILRASHASLVERDPTPLSPKHAQPVQARPDFPPSTASSQFWLVTPPSAMTFENVGFSKGATVDGRTVKYLACADCDCGPLGWHDPATDEYLLGANRLRYRLA